MSSELLSPVTQPGLIYPQLGKLKPGKKYYTCPRCTGNIRSRLASQVMKAESIDFVFHCTGCGKRWVVPSKLIFSDILEEQIQRIGNFTKQTKKEFGAFLIKTKDGILMDMVEIGEDLSVSFKQTHELKEGEKIVGTVHFHPISETFSDWDIATFLFNDFEKISIVGGAKGTITVMVKLPETVKVKEIKEWVKENSGLSLKEKAKNYKFGVYRGRVNNLQLISENINNPVASLEGLLKKVE